MLRGRCLHTGAQDSSRVLAVRLPFALSRHSTSQQAQHRCRPVQSLAPSSLANLATAPPASAINLAVHCERASRTSAHSIMVKPVDEAAAARDGEVTLAALRSHANTRRALAAIAVGSLAMAGSVLVFNPARRWVAERVEDAACSKLPKEMQNRLVKMRAWRNSLSTRQARSFATTGLLGRDLHGLIPSVEGEGYYYGQDLEKQFAAAVPGGATVYKHELAWVERSVGGRGEMDWTPVPARLNALRNENSLLVPAHMAEELGFEEGNLVTISIAGRHFTLPIAILAASPEEVEVVQEVFDAAQVSGVKLTPARLVADVAQLRADYARMITVPRAVLTALLADNITLILHS